MQLCKRTHILSWWRDTTCPLEAATLSRCQFSSVDLQISSDPG